MTQACLLPRTPHRGLRRARNPHPPPKPHETVLPASPAATDIHAMAGGKIRGSLAGLAHEPSPPRGALKSLVFKVAKQSSAVSERLSRGHMHTCTHTFTRTHARTCTHTHSRTHIHAFTHVHIHACMHVHIHAKHVCMRAHTRIHACMHTHTFTHTRMHAHTLCPPGTSQKVPLGPV